MRKLTIMLTGVIVLGTVGGVLAYKIKRQFMICTTIPVNGTCTVNNMTLTCQGEVQGRTTAVGGSIRCTTSKPIGIPCSSVRCPVLTRTAVE